MVDATEIEKKSLEAHVELCAERYNALEDRLEGVNTRIAAVNKIICEIRTMIQDMADKRNDQIIGWGVGIIFPLGA